ncbi:MAG: triose-phosphate isomerase [Nitrospina sp.]|nr:triose-phosphate isomerase [Nitrospina sp.]
MRKKLIAGNWKMNFTGQEASRYVERLIPSLAGSLQADVLLVPPFTALSVVSEKVRDAGLLLGAQDLYPEPKGAFTGEISADMLKDCGCRFVLAGHSERRHLLGETDALVNKKLLAGLNAGLDVIFCLGETGEQREKGATKQVLESQLEKGLSGIRQSRIEGLVVAYEPVWAIGTGVTATTRQAQEAHCFIRTWVQGALGQEVADGLSILYGGSVSPENAAGLLAERDIDGLLVGSASLDPEKFCAIISTAQ